MEAEPAAQAALQSDSWFVWVGEAEHWLDDINDRDDDAYIA